MSFRDPHTREAAEEAERSIATLAKGLRADLEQLGQWEYRMDSGDTSYFYQGRKWDYFTLGQDFWNDFKQNLGVIEINGTESALATAVESFISAILYWNNHLFSRVRLGKGDIFIEQPSEELKILVHTWDPVANVPTNYTQAVDLWGPLVVFCEESPLRNTQSMGYLLEYYENLVGEVKSTFGQLAAVRPIMPDERLFFDSLLEDLEHQRDITLLGFGDESAWKRKRASFNKERLRIQEEEAHAAAEREYRQQREESALEHRRMRERQLKEEQERVRREIYRLGEDRRKNQQWRWKIRDKSEKIGDLLVDYTGGDRNAIEAYTKGILMPFAVFYKDKELGSGDETGAYRVKPPPWPRSRAPQPGVGSMHTLT